MALFGNYFWRHVFYSAAICVSSGSVLDSFFAQAKVDQFDVSVSAEENVFRLQIAKNDAELVKIAKCESDLRQIEFGFCLLQNAFSFQHHEQLTALDKFEHQVQLSSGLEGVV